jgi:hydrogenase-4 component B
LAVACFVKVFGAVFLGNGRSPHTATARESGNAMLAPMILLVGCCAAIGLAPQATAGALDAALAAWAPDSVAGRAPGAIGQSPGVAGQAPLGAVSAVAVSLVVALAVLALGLRTVLRRTSVSRGPTWGCGYAAPTPRMQYTSSSFAQMIVRLFAVVLRPRETRPRVTALFPSSARFHSELPDATLEYLVRPLFRGGAWLCARLRLPQGRIQTSLLYIVLALVVLLLCR